MATSTVKMNGSWGRMALALVLSALLVHNGVVCDNTTAATVASKAITAGVATTVLPTSAKTDHENSSTPGAVTTTAEAEHIPESTSASTAGQSRPAVTAEPTTPSTTQLLTTERTTAPETHTPPAATTLAMKAAWTTKLMTSNPATDMVSSVTTEVPTDTQTTAQTQKSTTLSQKSTTALSTVPVATKSLVIQCVGKEGVINRDAVKLELAVPSSCEHTKANLEKFPELCEGNCILYIFQEDNSNTAIVTGSNVDVTAMANRFNRGGIKHQLGLVEATPVYEKHPPTVLVTLLIFGLLLAALLIGGYYLRERRNRRAKGMRLAEESYQADEENQGNTLVSVAPLHPPAPQEKPSINGESAKGAKIEPPPAATNGHSAAKAPVADTEL